MEIQAIEGCSDMIKKKLQKCDKAIHFDNQADKKSNEHLCHGLKIDLEVLK